jgi:polysaccharide biosynthesis/export protein
MIAAGTALLSGCAASSLSDVDVGNNVASATPAADVTGSVKTAAASPTKLSPQGKQPGGTTTITTASAQETSVQASAASITAVNIPGNVAYKIGPQDVLDVSVFKVPELSRLVQVSEAGTINYPLIGDVVASGLTARELEISLTTRLGEKYLQKPQIAILVKEFNSQRVTVEGAVKRPGVFPMQGGLSLMQAIALAQGFDSFSDQTAVVVRTSNGKRTAARFDLSQIRDGSAQDPQMQPGDVVIAGTSALLKGLDYLRGLPLGSAFAVL